MVTFKNRFFVKSKKVSALKIQSAKEADKIKSSFLLKRQHKFDKISQFWTLTLVKVDAKGYFVAFLENS